MRLLRSHNHCFCKAAMTGLNSPTRLDPGPWNADMDAVDGEPMPTPNPNALEFLRTRRSRPAKTLTTPVPDRDALHPLLEAAARSPDHGKLEPWRFIVLERAALARLADAVPVRAAVLWVDGEKMQAQFGTADLAVAVVSAPKPSDKIPHVEQAMSAGAVCLALLNAALAAGWGANWLTGWAAHDAEFVQTHLGLTETETIAGFIHIGTETATPPERPRPDLGAITTWVSE